MGAWRGKASKTLSTKIQDKFFDLQNPSDCNSAKKLICELNKSCGYGCQIHHVNHNSFLNVFSRAQVYDR